MPRPSAEIVPVLLMPPETIALSVMEMPFPNVPVVIQPALTTAPPIELLVAMTMPTLLPIGPPRPPVITPPSWLVTFS
jgi:hypothetical protein